MIPLAALHEGNCTLYLNPVCDAGKAINAAGGAAANAVTGLGTDIISALGHAIVEGMTSAASWALGGLTTALSATTGVDFTGAGFSAAWAGARAVGLLVGVPVLFIAVIQAVIQGSAAILGRVAAMLPVAAIGMLAGLVTAQGYSALVTKASTTMISASGDTPAKALGKVAATLTASTPVSFGAPLVMLVVLALLVLVGSLIIWVELSVAHGAAYLVMVFIPVALAASTWGVGQRFLRRLAEVLIALLSVPFVISAAMVVSGALVSQGAFAFGTPGTRVALLTQGVIVLLLGTLALPATMRLTHLAADAAVVAGVGGYAAKAAARHTKNAAKTAASAGAGGAGAAGAASASPGAALQLPGGRGGGGAGGPAGAPPPGGGRPGGGSPGPAPAGPQATPPASAPNPPSPKPAPSAPPGRSDAPSPSVASATSSAAPVGNGAGNGAAPRPATTSPRPAPAGPLRARAASGESRP